MNDEEKNPEGSDEELVVVTDPAVKYYEQSRQDREAYDRAMKAQDEPLSPEAEEYLARFVRSL